MSTAAPLPFSVASLWWCGVVWVCSTSERGRASYVDSAFAISTLHPSQVRGRRRRRQAEPYG
eukprot:scaffold80755_cov61-Phaeocystis_antarctica.AAC.3